MPQLVQILLGETFGTMVLILIGNAVVANACLTTKWQNNSWLTVCFGWGLAVAFGAMLSQVSGAHLNPAVTIGLWVAGKSGAFVGGNYAYIPFYILCQMLGAMLGQLLVVACYFKEYQKETNPDNILATFSTSPINRSYVWNTVTEVIGTFLLLAIIIGTIKISHLIPSSGTGLIFGTGPVTVGLAVTAIGLSMGGTTGFAINPARDLAPRILHQLLPLKNKGGSDWKYALVPVIGPVIGALLAGGFSRLLDLM